MTSKLGMRGVVFEKSARGFKKGGKKLGKLAVPCVFLSRELPLRQTEKGSGQKTGREGRDFERVRA